LDSSGNLHFPDSFVDVRLPWQSAQLVGSELQDPALTVLARDLRLDDLDLLARLHGFLLDLEEDLRDDGQTEAC
jgi:hypothetical protein